MRSTAGALDHALVALDDVRCVQRHARARPAGFGPTFTPGRMLKTYVVVVRLLEARRQVVEPERRVERGEVHEHVVEAREVADRGRDANVRVERVEVGGAADRYRPPGVVSRLRGCPTACSRRRWRLVVAASAATTHDDDRAGCHPCDARALQHPAPGHALLSSPCPSNYRPCLSLPSARSRPLQPSGTKILESRVCVKRYLKPSSRFTLRVSCRDCTLPRPPRVT